MGVNHSTKGTETVNAINNLALITGNIGRAGRVAVLDHRPVQRHGDARSRLCVVHARLSQVRERRAIAPSWPRSGTCRSSGFRRLAASPIRTSSRRRSTSESARSGSSRRIRSSRSRTSASLQQALEGLEFLVVQDGFHPTPTSEYADLVLPAAIWGEKEGTYTNSERRVSKANRAVDPPGEAKSDFDIFLELAGALGVRDELFPGWTTPADAFDEWKRVSAGRLCDYSGMTYEAIEEHGGIQWPFPEGATNPAGDAAPLRRWRVSDRRRQGAAAAGGVGAVSGAADSRVSARAQHRADGRALAHADEDGQRADPRAAVAECVARDEPARRAPPRTEGPGPRRRRLAARPRARRGAARDRDHRARPGVRARFTTPRRTRIR